MAKPLIGITADVADYQWRGTTRARAQSALTYASAVHAAGGVPVILAPIAALAAEQIAHCAGIVMSGGSDPIMEHFGGVTHPKAEPMHPLRQAYEIALLQALDEHRSKPALGICLGMQLMSLHAGGRLNQCLAETLPSHARHVQDFAHPVTPIEPTGPIPSGLVASNHRQGVESAGRLRVLALSDDGVIEAVDDPGRPFYLGVQWHPERTPEATLGQAIFDRLIDAATTVSSSATPAGGH